MDSSDEGSGNDERMNSDDAQSEEENEAKQDQKMDSGNGSAVSSPRSPAGSEQAYSPAGSEQAYSPTGSEQAHSPAGSEQAHSPAGSEQAQSPAGSEQAQSPVGSEQAYSPAGSEQAHSPAGSDQAEQSDEEVHISNEESAGSDDELNSSKEEVRENERNDSSDDDGGGGGSDNEDKNENDVKDDAEEGNESDQEGSVPEIDIDSGDENNDDPQNRTINESRDSDSENEHNKSEEKKSSVVDEDEVLSPPSSPKNVSDDEGTSPVRKRAPRSPSECDEEENANKAESDNEENKETEDDVTPTKKSDENIPKKNDSDAEGDEHEKKNLIANIFGESDEERENEDDDDDEINISRKKKKKRSRIAQSISDSEDEEAENKDRSEEKLAESEGEEGNENEGSAAVEQSEGPQQTSAQPVSDDDSDVDGSRKMREDFVSDFDLMMQKKKDENSRKRKRRDVDIINDSDDLIAEIIGQMRQAADEDRVLNKQKKTATKKLKILPLVMSQLKKQDLKMAFLDQGVLHVMADWLAPLPDRSLPNLKIREGMIKQLLEFPAIDQGHLKSSGVGRALMYLFKHPKETKENKERAGRLITEWARPIFNVTTDYHSLTKEEREQRDFDHVPTKKRKQRDEVSEPEESPEKQDIDKALSESDKKLRPGDKGWIGRARVPLPSARDYVVRPKWNVEMELGKAPSKKPLNRFEKHMRTLQEKKRNSKGQRAVTISIEGRKMAI